MEYKLPVTYKCNWNCDYCCADTHNQPNIVMGDILRNIGKIPTGSIVHIEGGEPGTMEESDLIRILDLLKIKECEILLNTNGLFLERYPHLVDEYITSVIYHCVEDISKQVPIKKYKNIDITYMLVINDTHMEHISWYFEMYPEIKFFVVKAIPTVVNGVLCKTLSNKNALRIHKLYQDNIQDDAIHYLIGNGDRMIGL